MVETHENRGKVIEMRAKMTIGVLTVILGAVLYRFGGSLLLALAVAFFFASVLVLIGLWILNLVLQCEILILQRRLRSLRSKIARMKRRVRSLRSKIARVTRGRRP